MQVIPRDDHTQGCGSKLQKKFNILKMAAAVSHGKCTSPLEKNTHLVSIPPICDTVKFQKNGHAMYSDIKWKIMGWANFQVRCEKLQKNGPTANEKLQKYQVKNRDGQTTFRSKA